MMCKILGVIHVCSKQQTIRELNNLPYPERGVCFLHAQAECLVSVTKYHSWDSYKLFVAYLKMINIKLS